MIDQPAAPVSLAAKGANPLNGRFATPGDRAISHRALLLGALAVGHSAIEGLAETPDVLATADALRQLGVRIEQRDGAWHVYGLGVLGLLEPRGPLNVGDAGEGAKLIMGALAPYPFATTFTSRPTQDRRPSMSSLVDALAAIGTVCTAGRDHLPLTLRGPRLPLPVSQVLAGGSDAVKSALLLAALHVPGITTLVEPAASPDHTERLLAAFGADIGTTLDEDGRMTIRLVGLPELVACRIALAGDPALAAYAIVAALTVPGSDIVVDNVLLNPLRRGLIDTLLEMGGNIEFLNQREAGGEPVADLRVRSSRLKGMRIDAPHAASMLDDIAILAVAAAFAQGETVIEGLAALRREPRDRLAAIAAGLAASHVSVTEGEASLSIGGAGKVDGGRAVVSRGDSGVAMAFLVLGLASRKPVVLDDISSLAARFPSFVDAMRALGGRLEPVKGR